MTRAIKAPTITASGIFYGQTLDDAMQGIRWYRQHTEHTEAHRVLRECMEAFHAASALYLGLDEQFQEGKETATRRPYCQPVVYEPATSDEQ